MPGLSRMPVPQHIVDQAQAYATGDATPVEPRNAATVVLMTALMGAAPAW